MTIIQTHRFREGFTFDEKKLRQICEILNRRLASLQNSPELTFQLSRVDSFSYTTKDIQEIIREENAKDNKIKELIIHTDRSKLHDVFFKIKLENNQHYPTYLEVEGDDQVLVSSMFSELKQYLLKRVNIWKGYSKWIKERLTILLITFCLIVFFSLIPSLFMAPVKPHINSDQIDFVLKNKTTDEKIDFIIKVLASQENEKRTRFVSLTQKPVFFIISSFIGFPIAIIVIIGFDKIENYFEYLFPRNVFLIGEGQQRYEQIKKRRYDIFWGLLLMGFFIALAVGLLGNRIFLLLTK